MSQVDFKKLAIIGIASGALLAAQASDAVQNSEPSSFQGIPLAGSGGEKTANSSGNNGSSYAQRSPKNKQRREGTYQYRPKQWTICRGDG